MCVESEKNLGVNDLINMIFAPGIVEWLCVSMSEMFAIEMAAKEEAA